MFQTLLYVFKKEDKWLVIEQVQILDPDNIDEFIILQYNRWKELPRV